jgi:hypothetical protein
MTMQQDGASCYQIMSYMYMLEVSLATWLSIA